MTENAKSRLAEWSQDELHVLRSVRHFEPTYQNPAAIRRDVRALLAGLDRLTAERDEWREKHRVSETDWRREYLKRGQAEARCVTLTEALERIRAMRVHEGYAMKEAARKAVLAGSSGGEKP